MPHDTRAFCHPRATRNTLIWPLVGLLAMACEDGGDSAALCERTCERTVACAPEFGTLAECKAQCGDAADKAAARCLTKARVDICLSMDSCDDYLACSFELSACDPGGGGGGMGGGFDETGGGGGNVPGTGGQGGGMATPLTVDTFAAGFSQALCGRMADCCSDDEFMAFGGSRAFCIALFQGAFQDALDELEPLMAEGKVTFDPDEATACIAQLNGGTCADLFASGPESVLTACDGAFQGDARDGTACENDVECLSRNCRLQTGGGTCEPIPGRNQVCTQSCQSGLMCDIATATCQPQRANGAACVFDGECASDFCLDDQCSPLAVCTGT